MKILKSQSIPEPFLISLYWHVRVQPFSEASFEMLINNEKVHIL